MAVLKSGESAKEFWLQFIELLLINHPFQLLTNTIMSDIFFGCSKQIVRYGFLRCDVDHMKKLINSLPKSRIIVYNKNAPSKRGLEVLINSKMKKVATLEVEQHPIIKNILQKWLDYNMKIEESIFNKNVLSWSEIDPDVKKVSIFWMGFDDIKAITEVKGTPVFCIDVSGSNSLIDYIQSAFIDKEDYRYSSGMSDVSSFSNEESTAYSYAKMFLDFVQKNNFCPSCGGHVVPTGLGSRLYCLNDSPYEDHKDCKINDRSNNLQFPRTDPVVIIALYDEKGRILLGSNKKRHPSMIKKVKDAITGDEIEQSTTMYSCFAGFMEPGETIEHACMREVYEETGLHVHESDIRIVESQPWPFPANLMVGCIGVIKDRQADDSQINIQLDKELDDVQWFDSNIVDKVLSCVEDGVLSREVGIIKKWSLPSAESVAGRVIKRAVDLGTKEKAVL